MAGASEAASARLSTYRWQKNMPQANKGNVCANIYLNHDNSDAKPSRQTYVGCGSHQHGASGTRSWQLKCPAWGQTCSNCGKPNHLSRACRARKTPQAVRKGPGANEAAMDTLIAHITFNQATGTYTSKDTGQIREIDAYTVPFLPKPDPRLGISLVAAALEWRSFPTVEPPYALGDLSPFWTWGLLRTTSSHQRKSFEL